MNIFTSARRCAITLIAVGAAFASLSAQAAYPEKPVRVVVGFAPGGTNDILARIVSTKLQEKLKQPFVVDNKPGANSIIAAELSAKAPADGYTVFVASSGALTINPALYSRLPYEPAKDFEPIALLGSFPLVVAANAEFPVSAPQGLKAFAAGRRDGLLNHGVGSSTFQLAAEYFSAESGVKFAHINYKGTGPVTAALLGKEVDLGFVDIAVVLPQIQAGKLKALAVTTAKRSSVLPNVPTLAESGVPGYDVPIWTALVAPAGTPVPVIDILRATLKEVLAEPDTVAQLRKLGMEPGDVDNAALAKRMKDDRARWTALAKSANIKAD